MARYAIALLLLVAVSAAAAMAQETSCVEALYSSPSSPKSNLLVDDDFDYAVLTYASSLQVHHRDDLTAMGPALGLIGTATGAKGPTVLDGGDDAVFASTANGRLQRIDPFTQDVVWSRSLERGVCSGSDGLAANPAVHLRGQASAAFQSAYSGDLVYVATNYGCGNYTDNKLYALNADDGGIEWTFNGSGAVDLDASYSEPALDLANDILYVTTDQRDSTSQHSVWAIDLLTGSFLWSSNKRQIFTPPLLRDGRIYVTTLYGDVHALDAAMGGDLWTVPGTGTNPILVEAVAPAANRPHDDLVLFIDYFGNLTAIRDLGASGTVAWSTALPTVAGTDKNAIALSKDGTFAYIAGSAGGLYKIELATGALVDTLPVSTATGAVSNVVRYDVAGDPGEFLLATADTGGGDLFARVCDLNAPTSVPVLPVLGLVLLVGAIAGLGAMHSNRSRGRQPRSAR